MYVNSLSRVPCCAKSLCTILGKIIAILVRLLFSQTLVIPGKLKCSTRREICFNINSIKDATHQRAGNVSLVSVPTSQRYSVLVSESLFNYSTVSSTVTPLFLLLTESVTDYGFVVMFDAILRMRSLGIYKR